MAKKEKDPKIYISLHTTGIRKLMTEQHESHQNWKSFNVLRKGNQILIKKIDTISWKSISHVS